MCRRSYALVHVWNFKVGCVFKMSAINVHSCFELCAPLVIDSANNTLPMLFNAVPNQIYLILSTLDQTLDKRLCHIAITSNYASSTSMIIKLKINTTNKLVTVQSSKQTARVYNALKLYNWRFKFLKIVRQHIWRELEDFIPATSALHLRMQHWRSYYIQYILSNFTVKIKAALYYLSPPSSFISWYYWLC